MANTIKIKRGLSRDVYNAHLEEGELAITTDKHELFVGTGPSKAPAKVTDYPKYIVDGDAYGIKSIFATESKGQSSLAFGDGARSLGDNSQAFGYHAVSSGGSSHSEGYETEASGSYGSHAEGLYTKASGLTSHAEGSSTEAKGQDQHVQGKYNIADDTLAHIVGNGSNALKKSNAHTIDWDGTAWYQGDVYVGSTSGTNKDDGSVKLAKITEVPTKTSQLTNDSNFITNEDIPSNIVDGQTEGSIRTSGSIEESNTYKLGYCAFAEGYNTKASGTVSHAEGNTSVASGHTSHAEGNWTTASGARSHAEGNGTVASGDNSHAEGDGTKAQGDSQHVQGKNNIPDTTSAYIIGNGTAADDKSRSNAHTIDWSGNAWFAGNIYIGSTSGTNKDGGSKKVATESQLNDLIQFKDLSVTTGIYGTFDLFDINPDDIILLATPLDTVNGYCITYKYYDTNKWYGVAHLYTGDTSANTTFNVRVFYIKGVANSCTISNQTGSDLNIWEDPTMTEPLGSISAGSSGAIKTTLSGIFVTSSATGKTLSPTPGGISGCTWDTDIPPKLNDYYIYTITLTDKVSNIQIG